MKRNLIDSLSVWKWALLMALVWSVASCSDDDPAEGEDERWYEDEAALRADYLHALADAQWPDASKVSTSLMPISEANKELEWKTIDGKRMVLVCTMLNQSSLRFWQATDTSSSGS